MSKIERQLLAISPLDGRYRDKVEDLAPHFSEFALIRSRIEIETKYLVALSRNDIIRPLSNREEEILLNPTEGFTIDDAIKIKEYEKETKHDVKAVERFLRDRFDRTSLEDLTEVIHIGLTSEDVNNLAYRLMLDRGRKEVVIPAVDRIIYDLADKAFTYKELPLLGRTHGQPAIPTTLGKELINFVARLEKERKKLTNLSLTGKLNGAVGNYSAMKLIDDAIDWQSFTYHFVRSLGFSPNEFTTQINPYEDIIEVCQTMQRINGIVLDLDQDMWRYISDEWLVQEVKEGEVGSSTMPQKVNPINFENSEGNLQIANGLFEMMGRKLAVSRLQRDLSDSTVIRNMGVPIGHSVLAYRNTSEGLDRVRPDEAVIYKDLNDNWSVLTEPAQIILRSAGLEDAYEVVKKLFRGKKITKEEWTEWVDGLDISHKYKMKLEDLTPTTYIGDADELVVKVLSELDWTNYNKAFGIV